jgi:hypothetical protein
VQLAVRNAASRRARIASCTAGTGDALIPARASVAVLGPLSASALGGRAPNGAQRHVEPVVQLAAEVGIAQKNVSAEIDKIIPSVLKNQTYKAAAEHATDFEAPLYNVWKQQSKSAGAEHFGNSEPRWLGTS